MLQGNTVSFTQTSPVTESKRRLRSVRDDILGASSWTEAGDLPKSVPSTSAFFQEYALPAQNPSPSERRGYGRECILVHLCM